MCSSDKNRTKKNLVWNVNTNIHTHRQTERNTNTIHEKYIIKIQTEELHSEQSIWVKVSSAKIITETARAKKLFLRIFEKKKNSMRKFVISFIFVCSFERFTTIRVATECIYMCTQLYKALCRTELHVAFDERTCIHRRNWVNFKLKYSLARTSFKRPTQTHTRTRTHTHHFKFRVCLCVCMGEWNECVPQFTFNSFAHIYIAPERSHTHRNWMNRNAKIELHNRAYRVNWRILNEI